MRTEYEDLKILNMAKYKAIRDGDPFQYKAIDTSLYLYPEYSSMALENHKEAVLFERVKFARK